MTRNRKDLKDARDSLLSGIGVPEEAEFFADPFQLAAIDSVISETDTLVVAPTGTGKTFIAVEGIKRTISNGKRAIYTTPLKALSNTKFVEFKKLFEPEHSVGLLTGDRKIEPDADVVVATTEIYRNDLFNYGESYSLVVLDELHYISDPQRGPVWEESIILSPRSATLLMLSASISNSSEIADWIGQVREREVKVIIETNRKVPLRLGFLHPDIGVLPLSNKRGKVFTEVEQYYTSGEGQRRGRGPRRPGGKSNYKGRGGDRTRNKAREKK